MILYGLAQECMGPMITVSEVIYGSSLLGCTPGGIQHGVCLGISIPFVFQVRDLVVRLLVGYVCFFRLH